jgi:ComF family protein
VIERVRSAGPYDGWLKTAIHLFKFEGESARAEHLAKLLAFPLADLSDVDALVPVPLHPQRLKERGFNQAELLASMTGKAAGLPVRDLLVRTRDTVHQVGLSAEDRASNVAGAFAAKDVIERGIRHVVLVDDVFTTGATTGECATALRSGGVFRVSVLTLV